MGSRSGPSPPSGTSDILPVFNDDVDAVSAYMGPDVLSGWHARRRADAQRGHRRFPRRAHRTDRASAAAATSRARREGAHRSQDGDGHRRRGQGRCNRKPGRRRTSSSLADAVSALPYSLGCTRQRLLGRTSHRAPARQLLTAAGRWSGRPIVERPRLVRPAGHRARSSSPCPRQPAPVGVQPVAASRGNPWAGATPVRLRERRVGVTPRMGRACAARSLFLTEMARKSFPAARDAAVERIHRGAGSPELQRFGALPGAQSKLRQSSEQDVASGTSSLGGRLDADRLAPQRWSRRSGAGMLAAAGASRPRVWNGSGTPAGFRLDTAKWAHDTLALSREPLSEQ